MSEKTTMHAHAACLQNRRVGRNANFILAIFFTSPHKKDCRKLFASQKFKQDAKTAKKQESDGLFVTSRKEAGWLSMVQHVVSMCIMTTASL